MKIASGDLNSAQVNCFRILESDSSNAQVYFQLGNIAKDCLYAKKALILDIELVYRTGQALN